jgi:S1-C subfamily serine protease
MNNRGLPVRLLPVIARPVLILLVVILSAGLLFGQDALRKPRPLKEQSRSLSPADILKREGPAVVMIQVHNDNGDLTGQASGVVIRSDGIVATNAHVVKGACDLSAKIGSLTVPVRGVVALDSVNDVAIVHFQAVHHVSWDSVNSAPIFHYEDIHLPVATMGDSRTLQVGDKVVSIGNPMGLD